MNKVILKGNLTRDPELRATSKGTEIGKLGLAINEFYTKDGEKKEKTVFVDVTCFGKKAETLCKYLRKGDPLLMEGKLELEQWEDRDGKKRQKLGVILETFEFLNRKEG